MGTPAPDARGILDFHVRLRTAPGAVAELLTAMDGAGIERAVVCPGGVLGLEEVSRQVIEGGSATADADNDTVLAACRTSEDRLIPCYFANPHRDPEVYGKAARDYRAVEISPAVHGVPLSDPRVAALVEVAAEAGHSVYTVCLQHEGSGVADLVRLAARFPEVTFVMGHCGIGNIDVFGISLVRDRPNIMVETSGGYTVTLRAALRELGADRVVFGSEHPLQAPAVELAKYAAINVDPDTLRRVMWDNAHRILREDT